MIERMHVQACVCCFLSCPFKNIYDRTSDTYHESCRYTNIFPRKIDPNVSEIIEYLSLNVSLHLSISISKTTAKTDWMISLRMAVDKFKCVVGMDFINQYIKK